MSAGSGSGRSDGWAGKQHSGGGGGGSCCGGGEPAGDDQRRCAAQHTCALPPSSTRLFQPCRRQRGAGRRAAAASGLSDRVQAPGAIVCCALHSACRSSVSRLSSAHLKQGCKALLWGSLCAIAQCTVRRKACASSWHARRLLDACRAATKPAAACCIAHSSTAPLPLPLLAWDIGSLVHHSLQPQRITAGFV